MELSTKYQAYIDCLNKRELIRLADYVSEDVIYNGERIGLEKYSAMLAGNYRDIPDLKFDIVLLTSESSVVACRLRFDCHPEADFLGLQVNGQHVVFHEHVFYKYIDGKIAQVWSVIDKAELADQLDGKQ